MTALAEAAQPLPPTRSVLIVDDYGPFRGILRRIIEGLDGYEVCGEAASAVEALEMAKSRSPDVAIIDLNLKPTTGLDLTKSLLAVRPGISVLIISLHAENLYAEA